MPFKLYALDNGSFIVVCPKCDFHLIINKASQDKARGQTVCGEIVNSQE